MSVSSIDESTPSADFGHTQNLAPTSETGIQRSSSSAHSRPSHISQGHARSTSLGASILSNIRGQTQQQQQQYQDTATSGHEQGDPQSTSPPRPSGSPQPGSDAVSGPPETEKPLPPAPEQQPPAGQASGASSPPTSLQPHIISPTPEEFLLVTGTHPIEPGIGMFVNLDGDPTRPTIEFSRYPKQVISYDSVSDPSNISEESEGFILASLEKMSSGSGSHHGIEIQRWDAGIDPHPTKYWLEAPGADPSMAYGLRSLAGEEEIHIEEIVDMLCPRRYQPFPTASTIEPTPAALKSSDSRTALSLERLNQEKELFERDYDSQDGDSLPDGWEAQRNLEEEQFTRRLAKTQAKIAVWSGSKIWWAVRNPLLIQLDSILESAKITEASQQVGKKAILGVLDMIRGHEPKTELEFMTLGYLRQKAGILLLTSLLLSTDQDQFSEAELYALEAVLVESKLDPRVVLSLVPQVRNEIIEGRRGIWVHGGINKILGSYLRSDDFQRRIKDPIERLGPRIVHFLRKFLSSWRKMKGFGSIADENEVFRTVDAALLLVLLELDQHVRGGSVRIELNQVVDKGVECFDRAVDLLKSYHRLFVLSRLYQSRKMAAEVLATWKRIIEGERDDGDEQPPNEERVRDYLTKISNQTLVKEYAVWLAVRNPKLGVQVFAEDKGKAPKFEPEEAVSILKEEAPDAVKYYLEHLVFGKGQAKYANDLIQYYLDVVIGDLESSQESRDTMMATYDAYRALEAPKPTYSHFLTDNAPPDDEVWHSRLRLLQLLGLNHDYDAAYIRNRISNLPDDLLVPESIILDGKARKHEHALNLLVHKLGDYDTAISYCLRGGSSVYTSQPGRRESMPSTEQQRRLFNVIFREFLALKDVSDRVEQTGALLERFGSWFEIGDVLERIPDSWSVEIISGFLIGSLRRLMKERHEATMSTALNRSQNLRVSYDLVAGRDEKGPSIEASE